MLYIVVQGIISLSTSTCLFCSVAFLCTITDKKKEKNPKGSAMAWWLMPRTPDPEVGGSSPTRVKPCCVLEQGTFTPQKVLVIPWKRWLRPNMTEKNQSTNQPKKLKTKFNHCIPLGSVCFFKCVLAKMG